MYRRRLCDLGVEKEINKVRFREKVLAYFPQAQEQSDGKNKIMAFQQGMQEMIKQATKQDHEAEMILLAKAAKIVWKDIIRYKGFFFDGKFPLSCQQESVPPYLKILVSMILNWC